MDEMMDVRKVMEMLPHRYPFLLVDRILELVPGEKIKCLKNVTINEPFFEGHFPGAPIMPGVLIVEAMAQSGGCLFLLSRPQDEDVIFYFMGMDKVKFRKPVVPGDQLIFEVEILKMRAKAIKMAAKASVDNKVVAEGEFLATIGEKS